MRFAMIEAQIRKRGWKFDEPRARELLAEMQAKMEAIENKINPQIGMVCVKKDSASEWKECLFKKNGEYALSTARWFDVEVVSGLYEDRLVEGDYCRITYEPGRLSSDKVLKAWLYSIGWVPDDWNVEKINGKFVQKSPKLTESSLKKLGDIGLAVDEYNSISNRHGILNGWLKEIEYDGRLHGRMWTIGTPTFRCRHEVVANLPKVGTKYGEEMRGLLLPEPNWVIVGADSAGNQMRGLCHDIGNAEFTAEVIDGDVHRRNADVLKPYMKDGITHKEERDLAKPFLYAFLFGAGADKVSLILRGIRDKIIGQKAIDMFSDSIPGLKTLKDKLAKQFGKTKERFGPENSFIRAIDGRIVFVGSKHQVLNYRLQATEGITCKAAAVWFEDEAKKVDLPFNFLLHYHDEFAFETIPQRAEEARLLAIKAFTEAPKWFGIECMNGDGKIGNNYAEVH
jgi:DNA polymerase-1